MNFEMEVGLVGFIEICGKKQPNCEREDKEGFAPGKKR